MDHNSGKYKQDVQLIFNGLEMSSGPPGYVKDSISQLLYFIH